MKAERFLKKVALVSFGCPKNLVDSEIALGSLHQAGFSLTLDENEADILVINTCSFIDDARQESFEAILELARFKGKSGKARMLVVMGCLAQYYGRELREHIPEIDLVIGTGLIQEVGQVCRQVMMNTLNRDVWLNEPAFLYDESTPRIQATLPHVAYVKIAEGCDNRCSYCLIPQLRGGYRSRTAASVIAECEKLVRQGVREINLIAQDTTAYGCDRPAHSDNLTSLLRGLAKLEGLQWIRLLYTYPDSISTELLECMAQESKICKYIDIPLQHINDVILRAMNRKSCRKGIENTLDLIGKIIPEVTLRTTFMVGFPGEKEKQFKELLDFVAATEFDRLGVFSFSPQERTPAANMKGHISQKVKDQRRHEILQLQAEISLRKNLRKVGNLQEVIIDSLQTTGEDNCLHAIGRTQGHAPDIDGVVYVSGKANFSVGEILPVKVIRADIYDLCAVPGAGQGIRRESEENIDLCPSSR